MGLDLKNFKQEYDRYDLSLKKETVLTMLQALLWKGQNFDNIYNFILQNPNEVYENELDEVFAILLLWMYQNSQEKLKEAEWRLDIIKSKMLQMKAQEQEEKKSDDPDLFLENAF